MARDNVGSVGSISITRGIGGLGGGVGGGVRATNISHA